VSDESIGVVSAVSLLNFVGDGVIATDAGGGQVDITIDGGGSGQLTIGKTIGIIQSS
jgi:hypothetical protein